MIAGCLEDLGALHNCVPMLSRNTLPGFSINAPKAIVCVASKSSCVSAPADNESSKTGGANSGNGLDGIAMRPQHLEPLNQDPMRPVANTRHVDPQSAKCTHEA